MNILSKKKFFSIITILLILSFIVSMFTLPDASAQSTREIITWPFVDAIPKTAGVGQPVLINWGLLNYLYSVDDGWNVTLQITYPDGKVVNHTGKTWSTGTVGRKMSFMEPGNYTLQCLFDGEYYVYNTESNALTGNYKSSESDLFTLQILEGYWKVDHPGHILPDEYWARPVDSQLREWYTIMGSWAARPLNRFAPWNDAPESAHILWSMPIGDTMGGLAGGDNGPSGFQNGDAYEGKFVDSVIIGGTLYYNKYFNHRSGTPSPQQAIVAVDLHTGKILWERSYGPNMGMGTGRISRGQILNFMTENNRGSWAYLWIVDGTNMYGLDANTGDPKFNMTNVPGGTFYIGPSGEMLKYRAINYGTETNPNWYLQQWNSTYVVNRFAVAGTSDAWGSQIQGKTFDASLGYDINVTLNMAFISGQGNNIGNGATVNPLVAFPEDRVIFGNVSAAGVELTGISLDPENKGSSLFTRRTWQAPAEWKDITLSTSQTHWEAFSNDPYIGVFWTKENRVNYAFSLENGRFLWETKPHIYSDAWTWATTGLGGIAYGKLYEASVAGVVYCYDAATGEVLWTYEATDKYNESYHGENWWLIPLFISDGKVYFGHATHSNTVPIARGAPFFALDCETGEVVWEIDGAFRQTLWGGPAIIGDSIITTMDAYDQQIYAIGKGPSEVTVSASNAVTTTGNTVLISGTVTDISPGTQNDKLQMRFPKGVPAVSEESMSNWMLYIYKQFERPMDTTGVEVTVFAQQGDNVIDIGTTVSDDSGRFSIRWTPTQEGDFDIYAYFSGSASYYGSWAKSEIAILETPEITEPEIAPYGWYIIGAVIIIVAAIAINIFVTLRKK